MQRKAILNRLSLGSGCSTSVEHTPQDREAVGSNPAVYWALFSPLSLSVSLSLYQYCVLNVVPQGGATLPIFQEKNRCLYVQLEAKQA